MSLFLVGIGGHGCAGKTTLARRFRDVQIVSTDEFWNGSEFELSRMHEQVIRPLRDGREARYRGFDWARQEPYPDERVVEPDGVVVIEGVCALHRDFRDAYDLRIWVDAPRDVRLARGVARDGEGSREAWETKWIPREEAYVERDDPVSSAHLVVDGTSLEDRAVVPRFTIPYESMDPLTIGAAQDDSKTYRDTLELEVADANLLAAIYPEEPDYLPDATAAVAQALESPVSGPTFSELIAGGKSVAIVVDNQFRPTPQSRLLPAVFDALEAAGTTDAVVVCANGKVFPMSQSDIEMKLGKDNLARMERLGIPFFQNEPRNADVYTYVGVSSRGTPVWLHNEVAKRDVKITIGQAQANHWGAGGGGKLILPGVVSDETIESNHCNFVPSPATHYGAYRGPMRSDIDEVATMCGLDATLNIVLDTRGRVVFVNFGAHPHSHREAIEYFNSIYAYESPVEANGQADIAICGVFAPTDHLFFHTGWGCMSADFVLKDGGTLIYCSPSPGVHTEVGDFPGLALMDLMKPYMPPTQENYQRVLKDIHARQIQMWAGCIWVPIYEVMSRKHLTMVTLQENLEMAADIGIDATTSLDEAYAVALERHGADAKVIVLPFARYQLPRNAIRMTAEDVHVPAGAHA